jgi:RNA polymerase sigma-70 factor, ECF subfamily
MPRFSPVFLEALEQAGGRRPEADLEAALADLVTRAAAGWAEIAGAPAEFLAYAAQRIAEVDDTALAVRELRAGDLAVAFACVMGRPGAAAAFEREFVTAIDDGLRRAGLSPTDADEVRQQLRHALLVPSGTKPPHLASYSGRGDLRAWLRVTAMRDGWRARKPAETPEEPDLFDALAGDAGDLELAGLRERFGAEFRGSFEDAVAELPAKSRTLLRYRYVDGLTGDEIAKIQRVHRATVVRHLADVQATVLAATRRRLRERMKITDTECDSLMRFARSGLDVSIGHLLARRGPGAT